MQKPNFFNKDERKKRLRQIKNYLSSNYGKNSSSKKINSESLHKLVIKEDLKEEFLENTDIN